MQQLKPYVALHEKSIQIVKFLKIIRKTSLKSILK